MKRQGSNGLAFSTDKTPPVVPNANVERKISKGYGLSIIAKLTKQLNGLATAVSTISKLNSIVEEAQKILFQRTIKRLRIGY